MVRVNPFVFNFFRFGGQQQNSVNQESSSSSIFPTNENNQVSTSLTRYSIPQTPPFNPPFTPIWDRPPYNPGPMYPISPTPDYPTTPDPFQPSTGLQKYGIPYKPSPIFIIK